MAKKNLNRSFRASATTEEAAAFHEGLVRLLHRHSHQSLSALLDDPDVNSVDRMVILSMRRFIGAPRGDADTLKLARAWFELCPELLKATKAERTRQLILWTDAAAKAYATS